MQMTNCPRQFLGLAIVLALCTFCRASDRDKSNVLAWARFERAKFVYAATPYLWLGHGDVTLSIDVAPRSGHVLEMLWGAKGDVRSAVASINGREVKIRGGGYDGFHWIVVPLPSQLAGDRYEVTLQQAGPPQAFIAAVRLLGKDGAAVVDVKKSAHKISFEAPAAAPNAGTPQPDAFAEMRAIWDRAPPAPAKPPAKGSREAAFGLAEINSRQAAEAFFRSRRFIDGWLKHADEKTGLIPRNLDRDRNFWNAKDAAADNYPFMVITSQMTDWPLFEGRMLDMLRTETRLTCRIGQAIHRAESAGRFAPRTHRPTIARRRAGHTEAGLGPPAGRQGDRELGLAISEHYPEARPNQRPLPETTGGCNPSIGRPAASTTLRANSHGL